MRVASKIEVADWQLKVCFPLPVYFLALMRSRLITRVQTQSAYVSAILPEGRYIRCYRESA